MNPEVADKGGRLAKAVMEGGAAGWSTLIGQDVSYSVTALDYGRPAEVVNPGELGEAVMTPVDWSGDNSGKVFLLVPAPGAKIVVAYMMALMLGGDPNPGTTQLDVDGMDAYSEAVNSFFGQGAQQARGEIGGNIKTTLGQSKAVDFSKTPPGDELGNDDCVCARIKTTITGNPPFTLNLVLSRSVTGVAPDSDSEHEGETRAAAAESLGIEPGNLDIAMGIKLPVVVSIATKKMRMELIQEMTPGTIIEFRKMSGENLDVLAGKVRIATAEAVIINQCFGVQVRTIVDPRAAVKE
jgi:flagellar motor switch/type III secretory pathway protein FliN